MRPLLCQLNVTAGHATCDILGNAHALYYHSNTMTPVERELSLREIERALAKLNEAFAAVKNAKEAQNVAA